MRRGCQVSSALLKVAEPTSSAVISHCKRQKAKKGKITGNNKHRNKGKELPLQLSHIAKGKK